jgi:hypothetical protein
MAVENMNGQFFGGKQITVQYAFKKDGKGERHGTTAERLLAAQAKWVEWDLIQMSISSIERLVLTEQETFYYAWWWSAWWRLQFPR